MHNMKKRGHAEKPEGPMLLVKFNAIVGHAVAAARGEAGLTQGQLAVAMRVPQSAVSRMESGLVPITVDHLKRVAWALKLPAHEILERAESTADELKRSGFKVVARRASESADAGQALGGAALAGILLALAAGRGR
jgi:transcriptional regulator with XRE-family HTH domain